MKLFINNKVVISLFLIFLVIKPSDSYAVSAQGTLIEEGIIKQDTIWAKEGSPYVLSGDIQIGAKLIIEPGVIVVGNESKISVFGELEAIGTDKEKIKFENTFLQGGSYSNQGFLKIDHSQLIGSSFALYDTGVLHLSNSWIDNSFKDSYHKNYIGAGFGQNVITHNIFSSNLPLVIGDNTIIKNNTFSNFGVVEVYGNSGIEINFNDFYSDKTNVINFSSYKSEANLTDNFWNTKDVSRIDEMIFDGNDDLSLNVIEFNPFLVAHNVNSPLLEEPSTPSSIEFNNADLVFTGQTEENAIVKIETVDQRGMKTVMPNVFSDGNGKYSVVLKDPLPGTEVILRSYKHGLYSNSMTSVVKDAKPPSQPIVDEVTNIKNNVTGLAEVGSLIIVKNGQQILGTAITNKLGRYLVSIPFQPAGAILSSSATDNVGNKSEEVYLNVEKAIADRIAGPSRYETAVAISQEGWETADTVILATGTDFPDALAGGPLAYRMDAPILLTKPKSLPIETEKEIQRLNPENIIILGSMGAVSLEIETQLLDMGIAVDRIGGKNRFETAALIARHVPSRQAIIASGFNFPDVLSVSPYAARHGIPILLTRKDSIPAETLSAYWGMRNTIVVGSIGAVSEEVFSRLPSPIRYGGKTRYDTGYEIQKGLPMGTGKAYIATGKNFPDALAGSVLAAKNNSPILLVNGNIIPEATNSLRPQYGRFTILGSTGAVGDDVKQLLDQPMVDLIK